MNQLEYDIIIFATFAIATFLRIKLCCVAIATDTQKIELCYLRNCVFSQSQFAISQLSQFSQSILQPIKTFNPIFGNAESIFMGRSINHGSTSDYKFSFPAFTFNAVENDQLHMVSYFVFFLF